MISASQLRAARALLDLSQTNVAEGANLSIATLSNIESSNAEPGRITLDKLQRFYEERGIKFTDSGVEKPIVPVILLRDETPEVCYLKLLEDVYETLINTKNPELLISNADDRVSPPAVNNMYRKMRKAGIKMRQLVEEGNTYLMGDLDEYRYLPKKYFINRVMVVYGDRVATVMDDEKTINIIIDSVNAATAKNNFNYMFDFSTTPKKSTADEKF